jgi:hypothetical protein
VVGGFVDIMYESYRFSGILDPNLSGIRSPSIFALQLIADGSYDTAGLVR